MVNARCKNIDLGEYPKEIVCWQQFDIFWVSLQLSMEFWVALSPDYPIELDYVSRSVDIFKHIFDLLILDH